jgi:hypothetical protein
MSPLVVALEVRFRRLGLFLLLPVALFYLSLLIFFSVLVLVGVVWVGVGLGKARQTEEDSEQQEEDARRFHGLTKRECLAE